MENINFIAIDFETGTAKRSSVCEVGICVVKAGKIKETKSWLVKPEGNMYNYINTSIHGISASQTRNAPEFPQVWSEVEKYLRECPVLVAHNASFDMSCIRKSLELYELEKLKVSYYCTLSAAKKIYKFPCNSLESLCHRFGIPEGTHHRAGDDAEMCARLFLQEIKDSAKCEVCEMVFCKGEL